MTPASGLWNSKLCRVFQVIWSGHKPRDEVLRVKQWFQCNRRRLSCSFQNNFELSFNDAQAGGAIIAVDISSGNHSRG